MDKLKFVEGERPRGERSRLVLRDTAELGTVDVSRFLKSQRQIFRSVFREMVIDTLRRSGGFVTEGIYNGLPPQHGAWERLEGLIDQYKFNLVDVTRAGEYTKNEVVFRVRLRFPTLPQYNEQLFKAEVPEGDKTFMLVSFYCGICEDFTRLSKPPVVLPENEGQQQAVLMPVFKDETFNPDKVLSTVLKNLRLEHRYLHTSEGGVPAVQLFYQSPEGFIYRIVVDGYATQPQVEPS